MHNPYNVVNNSRLKNTVLDSRNNYNTRQITQTRHEAQLGKNNA